MTFTAVVAAAALAMWAAPLTAAAQAVAKVSRIGFLSAGYSSAAPPATEAFRTEMRSHGWVEGQNIVIDFRFAEYE
jgi:hypothetical protein